MTLILSGGHRLTPLAPPDAAEALTEAYEASAEVREPTALVS